MAVSRRNGALSEQRVSTASLTVTLFVPNEEPFAPLERRVLLAAHWYSKSTLNATVQPFVMQKSLCKLV